MNPQRNTVLVKPEPISETTNGGIIVMNATPRQRSGEVIAAGPDCDTVQVGQRVLYFPNRAVEQGGMHLINEEDDVLAIL